MTHMVVLFAQDGAAVVAVVAVVAAVALVLVGYRLAGYAAVVRDELAARSSIRLDASGF